MPRQREIPRINSVTIIYNGDKKSFDTFMEAMISDADFVGKIEIIEESA